MAKIYLSPSTQEWNPYITGGNEEEYMNLVADAAMPWLVSSGIKVTRNTPQMTAASSIKEANAGNYGLYVALHSNASPSHLEGAVRGSIVFYYDGSKNGKRAAEIFEKNARAIYPEPYLVKTSPTRELGEITQPKAPSVLWEIAFHDNVEDATWIIENIEHIGYVVALSVTEYFGLPLVAPYEPHLAYVNVDWGSLNIRMRPSTSAPILGRAPKGAPVTILGAVDRWLVIEYNNIIGYSLGRYISFS